jgi:hypothetical protein
VQVEDGIWVANMIAQHKINKDEHGNPPIRYNAVSEALKDVAVFANENNASVHMPRIGCGLAGGDWAEIELIIKEVLVANFIKVTVYDF